MLLIYETTALYKAEECGDEGCDVDEG